MAYRISDLTVATTVAGADQFEFAKASASGSRNITAAALRTQLFGGGAAYSHDPLNVGGALLFDNDNAYDIGASGLNRPRTGYFGTSVVTTTLTGTLSTASQPNITTIGTLVGGAVPASLVTAGTFGAGAFTFPGTLVIGTDPGGTDLLRAGGAGTFLGTVTVLESGGICAFYSKASNEARHLLEKTGVGAGVSYLAQGNDYIGHFDSTNVRWVWVHTPSTNSTLMPGAFTVSGLLTASAGIAKVGINKAPTATSVFSITGLPTSSAGLATGDVWNNAGVLTIV